MLGRLVLYAHDVEAVISFYERYFGYAAFYATNDRIVELTSPEGGAALLIHPAPKSHRSGQNAVKLVFDIRDTEAFKARCLDMGLEFGPTHRADGYSFANAKDPCGNSISISSRAFRAPPLA